MAQHDFVIDNQSFPATRSDINAVLQAIASTNSGATAPSTTYPSQLWYDTSENKLYIRNEDNDAWIPLFLLDQSNDVAGTLATEIEVEDASGTDTTGTALTIKGGAGTGTGAGGSIIFQTADGAGSTGSSVNAHATQVTITDDGKVGIGITAPEALTHIAGATADADGALGSQSPQLIIEGGNNNNPFELGMDNSGATAVAFLQSRNKASGAQFLSLNPAGGNVGVGVATPDAKLHVKDTAASTTTHSYTKLHIEDADHLALQFSGGTGGEQWIWFSDDTSSSPVGGITYYHGGPYMGFRVEGSERMRITDAGNVAIGATTTSNKLDVRGVGLFSSDGNYRATNSGVLNVSPNGNLAIGFGGDSDASYYAAIFHNSSNTAVGSIFVGASSTTYATSSDYRLKENVANLTGAIERVKALAPKRFNFIADPDTTVDGFLAHEAATVVPEAVQGEKDAMSDQQFMVTPALGDIITPATDDADEVIHSTGVAKPDTLEDGQEWIQTASPVMETRSAPDYQGIDQSKLVPVLTAALQEAIAKIEALETRVAALES